MVTNPMRQQTEAPVQVAQPSPSASAIGPARKPYEEPALLRNPDLVDRIFDYIASELPQIKLLAEEQARLKTAVRAEFAGERTYVAGRLAADKRLRLVREVLALFNGRNASEVARRLGISRASVYRFIKQPGGVARYQAQKK